MRWSAPLVPEVPFKGPEYTFLNSLPLSSNGGTIAQKVAIQGGTQLSGFKNEGGGEAFSQLEVLSEATLPFLSSHPRELPVILRI